MCSCGEEPVRIAGGAKAEQTTVVGVDGKVEDRAKSREGIRR
jgi:hypothetical protein